MMEKDGMLIIILSRELEVSVSLNAHFQRNQYRTMKGTSNDNDLIKSLIGIHF